MAEWNVAHITPKDVVILRQNDVMSKIRDGIMNLPNSFNGGEGSYFVTAKAIWNDAFAGVDQLEYVASTRDVKFIGARAFENCVALKGLLNDRYYPSQFPGALVKRVDMSLCDIKGICSSAFAGCRSFSVDQLMKKVYGQNIPILEEEAFRTFRWLDYDDKQSRRVTYFVGDLPENIPDSAMAGVFHLVAENVAWKPRRGRKCMFVTIKGQDPDRVISIMNGLSVNGKKIVVDVAKFVDKNTFQQTMTCDSRGHWYPIRRRR